MKDYYLLIGAGFSRNWGGWLASEAFEYLLGDPAVVADAELKSLLWKHQSQGGFEVALDELQRSASPGARQSLAGLESAIRRMFNAMNGAFKSRGLEFRSSPLAGDRPVHQLLLKFRAIFSLNQDLLLEHCYHGSADGLVDRNDARTERTWQLPGMQLAADASEETVFPSATRTWIPSGEHTVTNGWQPIFKLHGSSNWRSNEMSELMILGGGKARAIERFDVLRWYSEVFAESICAPSAHLMVIGYSFRDDHINEVLLRAIEKGLKIFVVDPAGADVAAATNPVPRNSAGYQPTRLEESLQQALVGASRRPLSATFGGDSVELSKLMRFFEG